MRVCDRRCAPALPRLHCFSPLPIPIGFNSNAREQEALIQQVDKKRQRLVAEQAELERLMAALRGGEALPLERLAASLGDEVGRNRAGWG